MTAEHRSSKLRGYDHLTRPNCQSYSLHHATVNVFDDHRLECELVGTLESIEVAGNQRACLARISRVRTRLQWVSLLTEHATARPVP